MPPKRSASRSVAVTAASATTSSDRYHGIAVWGPRAKKSRSMRPYRPHRRSSLHGPVVAERLAAIADQLLAVSAPQPICQWPQHDRPEYLGANQLERLAGAGIDRQRRPGHGSKWQPAEEVADAPRVEGQR